MDSLAHGSTPLPMPEVHRALPTNPRSPNTISSISPNPRAVGAEAPLADPRNRPIADSQRKSGAWHPLPVALRQRDKPKPDSLSLPFPVLSSHAHAVSYLFLGPAQESPKKLFLAQPGPRTLTAPSST